MERAIPHVVFGLDPAAVALTIAGLSYGLIVADRFDRSIISLLGGGAMIVSGVLSQREAIRGIDFNTLALLAGMMALISIARRSGMFEFMAIGSARLARASPAGLLVMLGLVTALLSSLFDNVTTVLLVAPVTLSIARRLGVPPFPYFFAEIMAANMGGGATLVGDPPNILIGSAAGLGYNDFLVNLGPVIVVALVCQTAIVHAIFGRSLAANEAARAEIMALDPGAAIADRRLLWQSLGVLAAVLVAFVLARRLGLEPGSIALIGAAVLMLLDNVAHHRDVRSEKATAIYGDIDWVTIFFFVGLFIMVHGLEVTGIIAALARWLAGVAGGSLAIAIVIVLWGSALLSALLDNIPFVVAMIPIIRALAPSLGGEAAIEPLWWALSLGACLGGNGTLLGASANLTVAGIASRNGVRFDLARYTRYAAPLTLMSIVIAQAYLWWRFL